MLLCRLRTPLPWPTVGRKPMQCPLNPSSFAATPVPLFSLMNKLRALQNALEAWPASSGTLPDPPGGVPQLCAPLPRRNCKSTNVCQHLLCSWRAGGGHLDVVALQKSQAAGKPQCLRSPSKKSTERSTHQSRAAKLLVRSPARPGTVPHAAGEGGTARSLRRAGPLTRGVWTIAGRRGQKRAARCTPGQVLSGPKTRSGRPSPRPAEPRALLGVGEGTPRGARDRE